MTHVTFSGIDGCGKSTQIERLAARLEAHGRPPVRLWSRGGYTAGMLLAKRVARRLMGRKLAEPGHTEQRARAFRNPWTSRLWLTAAIVDLIRVYGLEIRIHQLRGRPVICDRYLWDTLVDFRMLFPDIDVEQWPLWRLLVLVAASPDRAFFLELTPEVAERRALAKGDPWPEPLEARQSRRAHYDTLKARDIFTIIDAARSAEDVAEAVQHSLDRREGGGHNPIERPGPVGSRRQQEG